MSTGDSTKVILFAFFTNLGIAASKFVGAFVSGSASLFAEAIHSLVDCSNQILLWIGARSSKRPPDDIHPLGYGRESFFWSFIVAVLLFSLGGLFAIYEGVHKIHTETGEMESPWLALGILIFGFVLESVSMKACLNEVKIHLGANKMNLKTLWSWFRKSTASELLVIFTEDLAALVGLFVAIVFLGLSIWTKSSFWDAVGSICIGSILVVVAVLLSLEIRSLIIGEAPSKNYKNEISALVELYIPGGRLLRLISLQTGATEVLLAYKVTHGNIENSLELINAINLLEMKTQERFPEVRWQFVEPDTHA